MDGNVLGACLVLTNVALASYKSARAHFWPGRWPCPGRIVTSVSSSSAGIEPAGANPGLSGANVGLAGATFGRRTGPLSGKTTGLAHLP